MENLTASEASSGNSTAGRLGFLVKSWLTLGSEAQSFLGARWIPLLLKVSPNPKKRALALRLLALSPHYFRKPAAGQEGIEAGAHLEAEFERMQSSRKRVLDEIVRPHIDGNDVVLDYGCGPGFLAGQMATIAKKVYACDISRGALESAKIINPAENVEYLQVGRQLSERVPDGGVDVIVSFAVIQHLSEEPLHEMMKLCQAKLKPGGKLVLQVQLDDPDWTEEDQWRADTSLRGRFKLRYGLHCFARKPDFLLGLLHHYGFHKVAIANIKDMVADHFDDICAQQLLTAAKPRHEAVPAETSQPATASSERKAN